MSGTTNESVGEQIINIIDELLQNDNLQASPSVWYGLHQIKQLLSADVRENVHGEWLDKIADIPNKCSICGCYWDNDYLYGQEIWYRGYLPNFCPNCGADMRERRTDEQ